MTTPQRTPEPSVVNANTAAEMLGVSRSYFYDLRIAYGQLVPLPHSNRRVKWFKREDVEAMAAWFKGEPPPLTERQRVIAQFEATHDKAEVAERQAHMRWPYDDY